MGNTQARREKTILGCSPWKMIAPVGWDTTKTKNTMLGGRVANKNRSQLTLTLFGFDTEKSEMEMIERQRNHTQTQARKYDNC